MEDDLMVSVDQLADLFGLTSRRVQQLANDDVVKRSERGKYFFVDSVKGYINYLNDLIPNKMFGDESITAVRQTYEAERAKKMAHDAEIAEMVKREKQGFLVNGEKQRQDGFKIGRTLRNSMMNIPSRVSVQLAGESDSNAVYRVLESELNDTLTFIDQFSNSLVAEKESNEAD